MLTTLLAAASLLSLAPSELGQPALGASAPEFERVRGQPFERRWTTDRFGRRITYYISQDTTPETAEPIVVYVQGSGCSSIFLERNGRIVPASGHATVLDQGAGRVRVVVVEKPGVEFLDDPRNPGAAMEASEEFRREQTLERWSEAVSAGLRAARALPGVDPASPLVMGHSEGGLVACRVAADNPFVTHVACLAGGGVTQLFDLMELARRGEFYAHAGATGDERVAALLADWARVVEDPDSIEKEFLGHPNRRWSSFLASSPMQELARTDAKVFIAQGTADRAVSVVSFDALHAQLAAAGRDVTARRIEGADHSFMRTDGEGKPVRGWDEVIGEVVEWYAADDDPPIPAGGS